MQQVRERMEKQLHRRAKELGYALKKIDAPATPALEQVVVDGEVVTVTSDGEIVK